MRKKQKIFIEEYLKTWNAAAAARSAGYSERSIYSIGSENLRKPDIAAEIARRIQELKMSADEVLVRLAEQARAEQADFINADGVDLEALVDAGKAHLIKKITPTKWGNTIEFYDAQAALQLIGKNHGLFKEQMEVEGKISLELSVEKALKKIYGEDDASTD